MIRVGVIGGLGRMGQETIKAVAKENDMIVGAVIDVFKCGEEVAIGDKKYNIISSMEEAKESVDVYIDFTGPASVKKNGYKAIELGKDIMIGATGVLENDIKELREAAEKTNSKIMIIPNFAIGAVLMMEFAQKSS